MLSAEYHDLKKQWLALKIIPLVNEKQISWWFVIKLYFIDWLYYLTVDSSLLSYLKL